MALLEKLLSWLFRAKLAILVISVVEAARSVVQEKDAYIRGLEISGRLAGKNPEDNQAFIKCVEWGDWVIFVRAVAFDQHDMVRLNFRGPWPKWHTRTIKKRLERRRDFQFIIEEEKID